MSKVTTNRNIDLSALSADARSEWNGETCTVESDLPEQQLQDEVDTAPTVEERQDRREQARDRAMQQLRKIAAADSLTAAQTKDAVQFTAKVLAKVLPFIDVDPDED